MSQITYIKLEKIQPSDDNVRFDFNQEELDELSESIRRLGVLEPLLVTKNKSFHKIVCGNMRYMAAKKVGLPSLPCIVIQGTQQELSVIQIHENIKRIPLSHIDQATTFVFMREKYKLKEEQIAALVGKSVAYVSQHITILNSGDHILNALNLKQINFSVARELSHIKNPVTRERYLSYAITSGASLETINQWVKESKRDEDFNPEEQPLDTPPAPTLSNEPPQSTCECCQTLTRTASIHFLKVCSRCSIAIKDAVTAKNPDPTQ